METPLSARRIFIPAMLITALVANMMSCAARHHDPPAELVLAPLQPGEALGDIREDGGSPARRGIPLRPEAWQKQPPCVKQMGEREIRGGCYFRLDKEDMVPPCVAPALEHEGRCYRAIAKLQREPTTIQR